LFRDAAQQQVHIVDALPAADDFFRFGCTNNLIALPTTAR
jgi:hypothetical protein